MSTILLLLTILYVKKNFISKRKFVDGVTGFEKCPVMVLKIIGTHRISMAGILSSTSA